jgi:hypothetical protein
VQLQVDQNDLRTLETELPSLVTTTDINEINVIKTDTKTVVEKKSETEDKQEELREIFIGINFNKRGRF